MTHFRWAVALLPILLVAIVAPGQAAQGRLAFAGSIVERTCPMRGPVRDCPPGRFVGAVVRESIVLTPGATLRRGLFAYALERNPSIRWRYFEITYR